MAKKLNKNEEKYEEIKASANSFVNGFSQMNSVLESAKKFFDYKNIEKNVESLEPLATKNDAIRIFVCSSILAAIIGFVVNLESVYFAKFTLDVLQEIGIENASNFAIPWQNMLIIFLSSIPLSFFGSLIYEFIAYKIAKTIGGKSTFEKHYYIISILSVSAALSTLVLLISPVPGIGFVGVIIYFVLGLYFSVYVRTLIYSKLHGIGKIHAFLIVLILTITTFLISMYAYQAFPNIFQFTLGK